MKTTYYYIQEKYPSTDWRTEALIGSLPDLKEAKDWLIKMRDAAKWMKRNAKHRILKVTEEGL